MSRTDLVTIRDLAVHFPVRSGFLGRRSVIRAVDGVSLTIERGETLGLVGESGCGKSTLGRATIRLRKPTSGTITFDGTDLDRLSPRNLRRMRRTMQLVFQDPYGSLDPRMTIGATLTEPMRAHGLAVGSRDRRVGELLEMVGLDPAFARRFPHEFSGGQRQRIGIARALAAEPTFIVCDEPISALDVSIRAQILNLLRRLRGQLDLTYLFIAHDLAVVRHIADRVAVMYLGQVVELGPPTTVYPVPAHPYTRALISAVPVPNPVAERRRERLVLRGDVPSPAAPPAGCRFHTRCWLYQQLGEPEKCRTEQPRLVPIADDRSAACHFVSEAMADAAPRKTSVAMDSSVPAR